jgi:hypothetical protein
MTVAIHERPGIADVDDQLRTQSYLWAALHKHGRERQMEAELLADINDLLDLRLNIMAGIWKEDENCEGC